MGELTKLQCAVLDFEAIGWMQAGPKEAAIREQFGWSSTDYYQALNALLDVPAALAYSPVLVNRLRRARGRRR